LTITLGLDRFIAGISALMQRKTDVRNPAMVLRQASSGILAAAAVVERVVKTTVLDLA
jgi:hypothetical protein